MPLPAFLTAAVSILGWVGIDLGISWITRDEVGTQYVLGLDFPTFIESYWLQVLHFLCMAIVSMAFAIPRVPNNGTSSRRR